MSHFTVLVIGDEPEKQLAPYDEGKREAEYATGPVSDNDKETFLDHYKEDINNLPPNKRNLARHWKSDAVFEELYALRGEDWNSNTWRKDEKGVWTEYSTFNTDKYLLDICPGLTHITNPNIGGIGYERSQVGSSKGNEILSEMWTNEDTRKLSESAEKSGRKVHVLPSLLQKKESSKDSGDAPTMALDGEVQSESGRLYDYVPAPEGIVCNLPKARNADSVQKLLEEISKKAKVAGGGPRSQDWKGKGAFMYEVQCGFGSVGGQLRITRCLSQVSHFPHIVTKTLIGGSKWDWFQLGGRWDGAFKPKKKKTMVNQIKMKDLDLEGMQKEERKKAEKTIDKVLKIIDGHPVPKWDEVCAKYPQEKIDDARNEYHNDPVIKALSKANLLPLMADLHEVYSNFDREEYIKASVRGVITPYALVKDGVWYERGQMGWFGCSTGDKPIDQWDAEVMKLIEGLPEDTLLSQYDCHI